ncbi:MAG: serine hydrolase, partial [Muribaculaceae bacterium]|nr:serine hydrolase [Muribaculaceae bacterium]
MNRTLKSLTTLLLLLAAAMPVAQARNAVTPALFNKVNSDDMNRWVEAQFAAMSPRERVAQLFVMAIDPKDTDACRARVKKYVETCRVGGLIYNESTIHDQVTITNYAQSLAQVPLMMTIDGEWGLAMRVNGTPSFPRNLTLGAVDNDKLLYDYGREVARELRRIGIHVNFAPVLDVNDNPLNPVIGTRSFGENPDIVGRHALAYARGLEDGNVLSVGKHFPGHGSSIEDSHKTLPEIKKSMAELNMCELVPFRRYIDAGLGGILTAHLYVPAIDNRLVPTTMSKPCVTDLLREEMGFEGLIFTDALTMKGATKYLQGSACVNALLAGNDILLMPANADAEVDAVVAAIEAGQLTQAQIDASCKKMLRYKYALGLTTPQQVEVSHVESDINSAHAQVVRRQLTAGSITVLKNDKNTLPVRNLQSRRTALVTLDATDEIQKMVEDRADDYAPVTSYRFKSGDNITSLVNQIKAGHHNLVLVVAGSDAEACRLMAAQLAKAVDHVVLTLLSKPYDIEKWGNVLAMNHVHGAVLTYENSVLAADYAVQTLFGGNAAAGCLPISVKCGKKTYQAGHGIHYDACRLGFSIPAEVGLDNRLLHQVDSVAQLGVREHAFPGCQVLIARHGKVVCNRAYGETDYGSGVPVTDNTIFGLASVSKATGTLSAVMKLYDDGKFKLDEPASRVIAGLRDGDKASITFRDLLYHETGMPPSLSMWEMMMDKNTFTGALI